MHLTGRLFNYISHAYDAHLKIFNLCLNFKICPIYKKMHYFQNLPNFQSFDLISKFWPNFQNFDTFSKFWPNFKFIPWLLFFNPNLKWAFILRWLQKPESLKLFWRKPSAMGGGGKGWFGPKNITRSSSCISGLRYIRPNPISWAWIDVDNMEEYWWKWKRVDKMNGNGHDRMKMDKNGQKWRNCRKRMKTVKYHKKSKKIDNLILNFFRFWNKVKFLNWVKLLKNGLNFEKRANLNMGPFLKMGHFLKTKHFFKS